MANPTLPRKDDLVGNPTAGTFKTALGQFFDYVSGLVAGMIQNTPAGNITATDVQSAINELDTKKASIDYVDSHKGLNSWQVGKAYEVGDICYSANAPNYARMECITAGTSAMTEPTWTGVGTYLTDGTVKWIVDDIRDGVLPGDIAPPSMIVRPGRVKLIGQLVNRSDYPRLWNFANTNGLATTEAKWSGGLWGLFSVGDGSTTFRLPDLRGEDIRVLDDNRGFDQTNITGNTTSGSNAIANISIPGGMTTAVLAVGMPISGSGIPTGATVSSIVSSTSITISANVTATVTGVTLMVTGRLLGSAEHSSIESHLHSGGFTTGTVWLQRYSSTSYGWPGSEVNPGTYNTGATGGPETRGKNIAYYATMKY
ncbi:Hypothetical protein LUCI_4954 [Lucifera butyrica]|uniref:Tail fiber protein n=1 Tax=Lucifera butyrica TaxID=1351585 RepID=A0A498RAD3_9FIRM|nr:phage tail protein [Lucifera butyrica]VBB09656.1 Hypothetical protein LUCI_4954 [Lucifera butyrica]